VAAASLIPARERRRLLVWGAVLLGALVAAAPLAWRGEAPAGNGHAGEAAPELLFPLPLGEVRAVEVVADGRLRRFERDEAGAWLYHAHRHDEAGAHRHVAEPAAARRIDEALGMFSRARIDRTIGEASDRKAYGLVYPSLIAIVYGGAARPALTLQAGDLAPDGLGRYALVVERGAVVVLPDYQIQNLRRLAAAFGEGT
jgi:hypothetical protein